MIGDNPATDIEGGRAAGLRTIWIAAGQQCPQMCAAPTWWWRTPRKRCPHCQLSPVSSAPLLPARLCNAASACSTSGGLSLESLQNSMTAAEAVASSEGRSTSSRAWATSRISGAHP
ncbi:HAD hydrolase-like protein [Streptomyces sp. NPDC018833]|uniref:HAD hydrolase-like protein n=1 Tax=Streptomyces sp. NPDC018833 TaxID=3365053 RepID=UPI003793A96F